eukprot:3869811-Rhodomonas_salina.2
MPNPWTTASKIVHEGVSLRRALLKSRCEDGTCKSSRSSTILATRSPLAPSSQPKQWCAISPRCLTPASDVHTSASARDGCAMPGSDIAHALPDVRNQEPSTVQQQHA